MVIVLTRKERDRLRRKNDILRAAEHIFALKGYDKATMQDIAKKAEYSVGTVYLYFKDKNVLYFSLLEEKIKDLVLLIREKSESNGIIDAREQLEFCLREMFVFFEENKDFFRIFMSASEELGYSLERKIEELPFVRGYLECIVSLMKKAQEQLVIRKEIDPYQAAEVFMSVFKLVIIHWFRNESKESRNLREISHFILDMFLNGIGPKNGNEFIKNQSPNVI